jgi:3-oxoacyl-[acyl-carrier-protein] synthase-3
MLNAHGLEPDDVRLVVPHQATLRILKAVASKTGIPMESFWTNLERYGNTSAASIPIAMTELQEQGGLEGQAAWVLSLACGSGLTWGAALLRS